MSRETVLNSLFVICLALAALYLVVAGINIYRAVRRNLEDGKRPAAVLLATGLRLLIWLGVGYVVFYGALAIIGLSFGY